MPYDEAPLVVQANNEDETQLENFQVLDRTSNVHVERNMDEAAGSYPNASTVFDDFLHLLLIISGDYKLNIF